MYPPTSETEENEPEDLSRVETDDNGPCLLAAERALRVFERGEHLRLLVRHLVVLADDSLVLRYPDRSLHLRDGEVPARLGLVGVEGQVGAEMNSADLRKKLCRLAVAAEPAGRFLADELVDAPLVDAGFRREPSSLAAVDHRDLGVRAGAKRSRVVEEPPSRKLSSDSRAPPRARLEPSRLEERAGGFRGRYGTGSATVSVLDLRAARRSRTTVESVEKLGEICVESRLLRRASRSYTGEP